MMGPMQPTEDIKVRQFNESFYRSDPADYLTTKFQLLLLAGGKQEEVADLLTAGVEYAGITLSFTPQPEGEEPTGEGLSAFLAIESQQLLHHAAETTLRLYLAHASGQRVPWIDVASRRNFAQFKKDVRSIFVDGSPSDDEIALVCLGTTTPYSETSQEEWDDSVAGIQMFLQVLARRFLDDAPMYNGIKHGIGVAHGEASVLVDGHLMGSGSSIQFPESTNWDSGGDFRDWSLTTRWLDLQESLGLIDVAARLIDSIWAIGRFRHLETQPEVRGVFFPRELRPAHLRSEQRSPMRRMSWIMVRETRPEKPGG